jgi:hypothetical protein
MRAASVDIQLGLSDWFGAGSDKFESLLRVGKRGGKEETE